MIATDEIKGLIRAHGMTQADVAKRMGIHEATLNRKLNKGVLNSNEIEAMISILDIKNPASIFLVIESLLKRLLSAMDHSKYSTFEGQRNEVKR